MAVESTATKRVVITGATRGLGRSMVDGFAARGHTVVGCGLLEEDVERLRGDFGEPHAFDVVDVSSDEQVKAWAEGFLGRLGPPDMLLNNAGRFLPTARLWEVSAEDFGRLVDVNIKGI